jgi:hypothetical protein
LSLIDTPEEKLIDCRDGRSAHCDGEVGSVLGVPGRRDRDQRVTGRGCDPVDGDGSGPWRAPRLPEHRGLAVGVYTGLAARLLRLLRTARRQAALGRVFSGLFATAALALSLMRATASV